MIWCPGAHSCLETLQAALKRRDEIEKFLFNNKISESNNKVITSPSEEFECQLFAMTIQKYCDNIYI